MDKKAVIIYASTHHGSTYKLVKAIADKYHIDVINAVNVSTADLKDYDMIGFASGIDFGKFYASVETFAKENLPVNKRVFFLYTCAQVRKGFTDSIRKTALERNAEILGEYGCKGFNTYGPWKLIGGMNKNHPSEDEILNAVEFFEHCIGM